MTDILITVLAYSFIVLIWSAFGMWLATAVIDILPDTNQRIWNAIQLILVLTLCGPIVWILGAYAIISVLLELRKRNRKETKDE